MNRFVAIDYSPWSEKARWALDRKRVPYFEEMYVPMIGEVGLRLRLRRLSGQVTVPVLFTDDGRALADSFAIARFADEAGSGPSLFPAGQEEEIRRWNDRSEAMLAAGRALSVGKALDDAAARDEGVPSFVPGPLRAAVGRSGVVFLRRKYGLAFDRAAEARVIIDHAEALRAALGGGRFLIGEALSYADVVMAVGLQFVRPVGDGFIKLGPATRRVCTDEALAGEFADLLAWRDEVYASFRRG